MRTPPGTSKGRICKYLYRCHLGEGPIPEGRESGVAGGPRTVPCCASGRTPFSEWRRPLARASVPGRRTTLIRDLAGRRAGPGGKQEREPRHRVGILVLNLANSRPAGSSYLKTVSESQDRAWRPEPLSSLSHGRKLIKTPPLHQSRRGPIRGRLPRFAGQARESIPYPQATIHL